MLRAPEPLDKPPEVSGLMNEPATHDHAVQEIRSAVAAEVDASSLRKVATEVGMSPSGAREVHRGLHLLR
jgi:hypothetical protein